MAFHRSPMHLLVFASVLVAALSRNSCHSFSLQQQQQQQQPPGVVSSEPVQSRRAMLFEAVTSAAITAAAVHNLATASTKASTTSHHAATAAVPPSCLDLKLPPQPANTIRLYLCRHGQTENNRLHKLQGGNVNPPLNHNGHLMAERLGLALRHSINQHRRAGAQDEKVLVYHSTMLRARQTAEIAADQFAARSFWEQQSPSLETIGLDSLVELDYSSSKTTKSSSSMPSRQEVREVQNRWMEGHIDERLGKETGRDVLERCAAALNTMVAGARSKGSSSVVAVAHGNLLRFLLASALDLPLAHYVAGVPLDNASVSVLDVPVDALSTERTVATSRMFATEGTPRGGRNRQFSISLPPSSAVRVNESRHLAGIPRS